MPTKKQVSRMRIADSPTRDLRGRRGYTQLLIGPETADIKTVDLHVNELLPGSGPGPSHYHELADNIYWVLEGTIEVQLEEESISLSRDEVLHIPPGIVHATSNPGSSTAWFIEIYAPAGDDFHLAEVRDG